MPKILLAIVTETEKTLRWITHWSIPVKPIFLSPTRHPNNTTATLHNAIIENMSRFRVRPVGDHTSVVLRELHLASREATGENPRRVWVSQARIRRPKRGFLGSTPRLDTEIARWPRQWIGRGENRGRQRQGRDLNLQLGSKKHHSALWLVQFRVRQFISYKFINNA